MVQTTEWFESRVNAFCLLLPRQLPEARQSIRQNQIIRFPSARIAMALRVISRAGDGIARAVWVRNASKADRDCTASNGPPFDQGDSGVPTVRTCRSHVGGLLR